MNRLWLPTNSSPRERSLASVDRETAFGAALRSNATGMDRLFAVLMGVQWLACVVISLVATPLTWNGGDAGLHVHVLLAGVLGGLIAVPAAVIGWTSDGAPWRRHTLSACQALFSSLLIHLLGGRIEAHFHVFVSLAVLAFYRDTRVLLTAAAIVVVDHFVRGAFAPWSIYGVRSVGLERSIEHSLWAGLEVTALGIGIARSRREMRTLVSQRGELEQQNTELQKLSLIAEKTVNYVIVTDAEQRIMWVNAAFERMTGWTLEEVRGLRPGPLLQGAGTDPDAIAAIRDGLRAREPVTCDILNYARDGRAYWVTLDIQPIEFRDGTLGFMGMQTDITRQKEQEAATLRAKREAERANTAKSEFLANMSHEIRTPLNGVVGCNELLLQSDLDDDQRTLVETARTSAESLLAIVSDILDLSKIDAGHTELERVPFDIGAVIASAAAIMRPKATLKGVSLAHRVDERLRVPVEGDPTRLRQILLNLIGNAIKFTERGGVLVDAQLGDYTDNRVRVRFAVTDTGIGIPRDRLDSVFEAFRQADSSTTRRFGGTGLGLAIVRELTQLMGGTVRVESEPGVGSTFLVEVAFDRAHAIREQADPSRLQGRRLLVVDDDEITCKLFKRYGENLGLEVLAFTSPSAAVDAVRSSGQPIDLAVLDYVMPGLNGAELLREIGTRVNLPARPLLVTSADPGTISEEDRVRFHRVLSKPLTESLLREALLEALDDRREPPATGTPRVAQPAPPNTAQDSDPLPGMRILVVEDNPTNQLVIRRLLERSGATVTLAADGRAAVDAWRAGRPDLVLMDCHMPEMDGFEATRAIRGAEAGGTRTPIIALTASALAGDRERCLEAGMDGYASKPVRMEQLAAEIQRITAGAHTHITRPGHRRRCAERKRPCTTSKIC